MTDDIEEIIQKKQLIRERLVISIFLFLIALFGFYAVYEDWEEGASYQHIIFDCIINLVALLGSGYMFLKLTYSKHRSIRELKQELKIAKSSADQFKEQIKSYRQGVTDAITTQFKVWKLTPAEEEICLFILKGFSLQEIAELRKTSERTIRQQASILYKKCGLSGRAQLSAFFIEDLLVAN